MNAQLTDDVTLLQQISNGSERAMQQFYERHSGRLHSFLLRTLNNPVDAAEVLNETMLEVWRKADTFEGRSQVTSWLFSIARFRAIDLVRKQGREPEREDESAADELACPVGDSLEASQDQAWVKRCMDKLKDGHRNVVYLAFYEGLSYGDIADIMQVPAGTIKTRMLHAKNQLQNCLAGLWQQSQPA